MLRFCVPPPNYCQPSFAPWPVPPFHKTLQATLHMPNSSILHCYLNTFLPLPFPSSLPPYLLTWLYYLPALISPYPSACASPACAPVFLFPWSPFRVPLPGLVDFLPAPCSPAPLLPTMTENYIFRSGLPICHFFSVKIQNTKYQTINRNLKWPNGSNGPRGPSMQAACSLSTNTT